MANPEHLQMLAGGVAQWNAWRQDQHPALIVDLNGADLGGVSLVGANLSRVLLHRADLRGANLEGADLRDALLQECSLWKANLSGASLDRALLMNAHLPDADLPRASLVRCKLVSAALYRADLRGADLSGADLTAAVLTGADLSQAKLVGADLSQSSIIETKLGGADLTGCRVYGVSPWAIETDESTKQERLIITRANEPVVEVDDLEVAQFMYLLLSREKLRLVLNAVTQRGVLILGRFGGGGIELLHEIAGWLRSKGYLPMIFDFERPRDQSYTETVQTLVGLARLVIVDLSGPSVPQELQATVPLHKIPFVPILEEGKRDWAMAGDLLEYPWVLGPSVEFGSNEELLERLPNRIKKAERRIKKREERLRKADEDG